MRGVRGSGSTPGAHHSRAPSGRRLLFASRQLSTRQCGADRPRCRRPLPAGPLRGALCHLFRTHPLVAALSAITRQRFAMRHGAASCLIGRAVRTASANHARFRRLPNGQRGAHAERYRSGTALRGGKPCPEFGVRRSFGLSPTDGLRRGWQRRSVAPASRIRLWGKLRCLRGRLLHGARSRPSASGSRPALASCRSWTGWRR
jgi:hypothetical protein